MTATNEFDVRDSILFMDDDPDRHAAFSVRCPNAVRVTSAAECIEQLKSRPWDEVHLDHDLDEVYQDPASDNCGTAVVRWVYFNKPAVKLFVVHSHNGRAARNMVRLLALANYGAIYSPFKAVATPAENGGDA